MTRYAALLRGINLGSHAKIKMPALRQMFEDLGYSDVQTYLQSGNVIFTSDEKDADRLARAIERRITHDFDLEVPILIRSAADLADVVKNNPFLKRKADPATLHVTFLADAPERERVEGIDPAYGGPDAFEVVGRDLYVCCQNGYGRTKLNNNFFERRLKVDATTRNWKTVTKLREVTGE